jgi:PAS domain S-box-containing protein
MMLKTLSRFLFGTLRGRLIIGVAAVHAVMMALFVGDLTARQRAITLDRQIEETTALSQALATSAAGWIVANDISGLQELVEAQRRYPEILFAILADQEGRVLADTDKSRQGLFMLDLPREARQTVLSGIPPLVDVAVPAMIGGRHVGWARVGIGQKATGEKLMEITRTGVFYALAAIFTGSVIAWLMGRRITRRLYAVQETIDAVRSGDRLARSPIDGADEAAAMAREFNSMLDALAERDAELRASEQSYRSLIRKVQTAIVLHDGQGRILTSNPMAQELLGLSEDQLLGKALIDQDWHFLREDGSVLPVAEYPASLVLSTRQPLRGQVTGISRPDREDVAWVLVNAEPEYDEAGGIALVIVSFVDITERKRAEEKGHLLSAIVQSSDDAIISKDLDGVILSWNRGAERIYGYSAEEVVGKSISMLVPHEHADELAEIMTRLGRGERIEHFTTKRMRKDSQLISVSLTISPILNEAGNIVAASTIAHDITGQVNAEEEILRLNKELEERVEARTNDLETKRNELTKSQKALMNIVEDLNQKTAEIEAANAKLQELERLKSMFIASMSHELRTPLNSIIGFSSILLNEWLGPVSPEQKENLATILRSGKHLLNLINDVIDVSKIEAGKIEIRFEQFDLYELISEAVQYVEKDIREKGLELHLELQHQTVCTDRRRLLQCIINLLSNALKFTEQGVITVETSREIDATESPFTLEGASVSIAVHDTGIGIAAEDIPRLFQPFVRLDSPTKTAVPGTGLGLYLTRKLVDDVLHGIILCTSSIGVGSTFTIGIPEGIE